MKSFFSKINVTKRMIVPFTLSILIISGISVRSSFVYLSKSYRDNVSKDALINVQLAADNIDRLTLEVASTVNLLSEAVKLIDKQENQAIFNLIEAALKVNTNIYGSTFAFNPDAGFGTRSPYVFRNSTGAFETSDLADSYDYLEEEWYKKPVELRQTVWSEPYFDDGGGDVLMVTYSVAVYTDDTRELLGVITGDIELAWLKDLIATNENDLFSFVISKKTGTYIAHPNKDFVMNNNVVNVAQLSEIPELEAIGKRMIAGQKAFDEYFNEIDGIESFVAFAPTSVANWSIAIVSDKSELLGNVNTLGIRQSLITGIGTFFFILLIVYVSRSIKSQLGAEPRQLIERLQKLAKGEIFKTDAKQNYDDDSVAAYVDTLLDSMATKAAFADAIGKEDFSCDFTTAGEGDVLGNALLEMRDNLQKARKDAEIQQEDARRRNWATGGLAKMGELLRLNNENLNELSSVVISEMVKYLDANQGGLFVLNDSDENNKYLELTACYAYDRKKFSEKHIEIGEGLTGTCFVEGETIYMTEIPPNYLEITSGLGGDVPKALLITPLKINEQVFGVIELASFVPFEDYQIAFVEKVSESIASTLSSVKTNMVTHQLLERSKQQAELMGSHEEDLRQAMEEMQATQDETHRREKELNEALENMKRLKEEDRQKDFEVQQFHDTIFDTCNVVEFASDAMITDVNKNILKMFNLAKSDIVGKHISAFIGTEAYNSAWVHLMQGKPYEDVQNVDAGNGKILKIRQNFMPIVNIDGLLQRVFLLAFPEGE